MPYKVYQLGQLNKGRVVEVTLKGNYANVYLMSMTNYDLYIKGESFNAVGGLMRSSPIKLQTPINDTWVIVIDLPNNRGTVKITHRIHPQGTSSSGISEEQTFQHATRPRPRPIVPPRQEEKGEDDRVKCPTCGHLAKGKFCSECGGSLIPKPRACTGCDTVVTHNCKFCNECGSPIGTG